MNDFYCSYPLIKPEIWSGVGCFLHTKLSMFGEYFGHARSRCGGLNKEHLIMVHWGPNSFDMPRGAKMSLPPYEPLQNILRSLAPSMPKTSPNMESFVCKITNSL